MTAQHYHVFESELGYCGIAWCHAGLTRVQLPAADAAETGRLVQLRMHASIWSGSLPSAIETCVRELQSYARGNPVTFANVTLGFDDVPDFNARIYRVLRQIPWGETTTYGALAKSVGEPGAARAVGMAMGRNPWPIIVPCHRVLAAQKKIGGFSAPGGAATKEVLLRLEGSSWSGDDRNAPLLPGLLG